MTKTCRGCGIEKEEDDYHSPRISRCKDCIRARRREIRNSNIEAARAYDRDVQREARRKIMQYIWLRLREGACVDCGEADPVVLEFDHVRGNKEFSLSEAVQRRYTFAKIDAEIAKCEVRCANCHRRKTARTLGWYKNTGPDVPERQRKVRIRATPPRVGRQKGSAHYAAKLTEEQVREIRAAREAGESFPSIAKRYPVSMPAVAAICYRKKWRHVV